ncbi:BRCT domain-containing protein [Haloferax prahovense]|nr:BRCT domain-containing protein [Haloferax prahovense]
MSDMEPGHEIGGAGISDATDLDGLKVVFTGRLSELTRSESTELVESHGGKVTNNISHQSDVLVVGKNPGSEKIEFFEENEIPTLTEPEFYSLFGEKFSHVEGVSADVGTQSTLAGSDDDTIEITIQPLLIQIVTTDAEQQGKEFNSVVEDSTRHLLKRVIDGTSPSWNKAESAESVEVTLPDKLLAMVETVVSNEEEVDSVGDFVSAAIRAEYGFDSIAEEELTIELPNGVLTAIELLSENDDDAVDQAAKELIYEGLQNRLQTE